jgi:hypothetical protein
MIEAPGGAETAELEGTFSVIVSVCPVAVRTVTVHVSAMALGSAAMPWATSTVPTVPIATRSFRLLITSCLSSSRLDPAWDGGVNQQATHCPGALQRGTVTHAAAFTHPDGVKLWYSLKLAAGHRPRATVAR